MISLREIVLSIYGAWRLAVLDRGSISYFDPTAEGFWRSFFAALLVAPAYIAINLIVGMRPLPDDLLRYGIAHVVTYALSWLIWPLIIVHLARALGRAGATFIYLTAHNWSQVVSAAFYLAVAVLAYGLLPEQLVFIALLTATLAILVYEWFIARTALQVSAPVAASIVALYVVVSLIVDGIGDGLAR